MKEKRSKSLNFKRTQEMTGISSQLEVLNNNKNILVQVVANRITERIRSGKIGLFELDKNNVKQLINQMIMSFKTMSVEMNPNSGLINYNIVFKEALDLVRKDLQLRDFTPENT